MGSVTGKSDLLEGHKNQKKNVKLGRLNSEMFEPVRSNPKISQLRHIKSGFATPHPDRCGASACAPSSVTCHQPWLLTCNGRRLWCGARLLRSHVGLGLRPSPHMCKGGRHLNFSSGRSHEFLLQVQTPRWASLCDCGAEVCTSQRYYSNGWSE